MGADRPVVGCIMCDSLYVKPTGNLPCWDDVGEDLILRTLDERKLIAGEEEPVFSTPELVDIRKAFLEQRVPHEDFCHRCPLYGHGVARSLTPTTMNVLHVEPAYLCQLACPQCFLPKERLTLEKPPYYMTLDFYRRAAETVALEIDSAIPTHVLDTPTPLDSHLDLILRLASPTTKQQLAALRRASDDWTTAQRLSDQRSPEVDAPTVASSTVAG